MNIVIINQNEVASASLTQYSADAQYALTDIRVYIDKTLTPPDTIEFKSEEASVVVTCQLSLLETAVPVYANFDTYILKPDSFVAEGTYIITGWSVSPIQLIASPAYSSSFDINDEHNALSIVGRTIQIVPDQVQLVAEDSRSQEIRFKIKKRYDNVSFLDDSKVVAVDFIPAQWETVKRELIALKPEASDQLLAMSFVTDEKIIREGASNDEEYIYLRWIVPLAATLKAGSLKLALCIYDTETKYVWQTIPATLTISPNIGQRSQRGAISVSSKDAQLNARVAALEEIFAGLTEVTLGDIEESEV